MRVNGGDAGTYSLHSEDLARAGLPVSAAEVGLQGSDLEDGIHPQLATLGARARLGHSTTRSSLTNLRALHRRRSALRRHLPRRCAGDRRRVRRRHAASRRSTRCCRLARRTLRRSSCRTTVTGWSTRNTRRCRTTCAWASTSARTRSRVGVYSRRLLDGGSLESRQPAADGCERPAATACRCPA